MAIVNDTMARRYWPGQSPIGKRVILGGTQEWIEVIGIVADIKHWGLDQKVNPELYFPLPPVGVAHDDVRDRHGRRSGVAGARRFASASARWIPNLPINGLKTMEEVASVSVASRRGAMLLLAVFGGLALVLAAAGIHGVMSHLVALRTPEIGVRMTLGATPGNVMGLILREGTIQAVVGLAIGLTGGVLLMRTFQSMLFGVAPADRDHAVGRRHRPARHRDRRVRHPGAQGDARRPGHRGAWRLTARPPHRRIAHRTSNIAFDFAGINL